MVYCINVIRLSLNM